MAGKGSRPRPFSIDQKTFNTNWDNIFKKKEIPAKDDKNRQAEKELSTTRVGVDNRA